VLTRRAVLALAGAALAVPSLGQGPALSAERGRFTTANRRLAPFARDGERVYAAGETSLEAWSMAKGDRLWQRPAPEGGTVFKPRLEGQRLLAGGRDRQNLVSIEDGAFLWSVKAEIELGVPLLLANRLLVGDGHWVRALDLANGREDWRFATTPNSKVAYGPALWNDRVLIAACDGRLYALDLASGRPLWALDREKDWQYLRQLHLAGDVLVAGGYHDELYGIDPDQGRVLWRFVAGNFVNSHRVAGDRVLFWSPTGWIYCLEGRTGRVIWRHRTTDYGNRADNWGPLMAEIEIEGNRVYCMDMKPVLHILDLEKGHEAGRHALPPVRPFLVPEPGGATALLGTMAGEILRWSL
jgi:outer membrane protein assembly factor BamB